MSGSFGIPPGTQWLQQGRGRRRRREPATEKQRKQDKTAAAATPMLTLADEPVKGSHQFGLSATPGGGWQVWHSPPDSDEWEPWGREVGHDELGDALQGLEYFRNFYRNP